MPSFRKRLLKKCLKQKGFTRKYLKIASTVPAGASAAIANTANIRGERMTTEKELKPCPFCGEKEDIDYGIMTGTMQGFDYVQCQSCGAEIHAIHKGKYIDAIKAWNRRAGNG